MDGATDVVPSVTTRAGGRLVQDVRGNVCVMGHDVGARIVIDDEHNVESPTCECPYPLLLFPRGRVGILDRRVFACPFCSVSGIACLSCNG